MTKLQGGGLDKHTVKMSDTGVRYHNESYPPEPTNPPNIDFHGIVIFPVIDI